jgi:hypothetical protein
MTPWFTPGCGPCVVAVGVVVLVALVVLVVAAGAAAGEPLLPEPVFAPELAGAAELAFPPEAVWPPEGALPPLVTLSPEALTLLGGAAGPDVAPLLGVIVPESLAGEVAYVCPATAAVAGCTIVVLSRCAKSYAIAPPRARVAMTFSVMNTIATRSFTDPLPLGVVMSSPTDSLKTSPRGISCSVLSETVGRSREGAKRGHGVLVRSPRRAIGAGVCELEARAAQPNVKT